MVAQPDYTAVNAPGTSATSTTSLAIGTGSKSLTVQTGKAFVVGQWVTITSTASPANWMHGQITAYTSVTGALAVNVAMVGGSNVFACMLPRTATITIATPATVTSAGHGLTNGKRVQFTTSGVLPAGIFANTTYFVVNAATDTFNLSATQGGAAISTSGGQSGAHVVREVVSVTVS